MLGWEPAETHEHYDAAGNLTGTTVVTREPEWDDDERRRLLALAAYHEQTCDRGHHPDVAGDPHLFWTFEDSRCPLCAEIDKWQRIQHDRDAKAIRQLGDEPSPFIPRPDDGRSTYLRRMTPDEVTARRQH
ncbi:hypothetical protein [Nocardioides bruguierae]|uniref:Uncharacterized protein n=1 Tax=Nocardioides bruguierae TaxID=2945102 RepID=A0A9X2DB61_9ACTN|nr:hypothetical protein [Nocardioides bruguierae]MCM0622721.1 hypothetical protein [Nocardioides bruguierae]